MLKEVESNYRNNRIQENQKLIDLCEASGYLRHALTIMWQNVRESIFHYLEENKIGFKSTKEGILKFLNQDFEDNLKSNVLTIYTVGTMAEWDNTFKVTKKIYKETKKDYKYLIYSINIS